MKEIYEKANYVADPHGAVGYLGAKEYLKGNKDTQCVFLETAHPVKFLDVVEETLNVNVVIPSQIESVLDKEKKFQKIKTYEELKVYLNS